MYNVSRDDSLSSEPKDWASTTKGTGMDYLDTLDLSRLLVARLHKNLSWGCRAVFEDFLSRAQISS